MSHSECNVLPLEGFSIISVAYSDSSMCRDINTSGNISTPAQEAAANDPAGVCETLSSLSSYLCRPAFNLT